MRTEQAEEFTEALGQVLGGAIRLTDVAHDLGIPQVLGLTPTEWTERRLAGAVRLSVPERRAVVAELTERGMSTRQIGTALGVDHATVVRDGRAKRGADAPPEDAEAAPGRGVEPLAGADAPAETEPNGRDRTVMFTSETDEWETPQPLFERVQTEFGLETDVCATEPLAKCSRYYSPEQDGLAQEWSGRCWMNPPYGQAIGAWVTKAYEAARSGALVVCLVPARVDTAWFWNQCRHGEVRFLRGRLTFGGAEHPAPFPSALVVFGADYPAAVRWWEP